MHTWKTSVSPRVVIKCIISVFVTAYGYLIRDIVIVVRLAMQCCLRQPNSYYDAFSVLMAVSASNLALACWCRSLLPHQRCRGAAISVVWCGGTIEPDFAVETAQMYI